MGFLSLAGPLKRRCVSGNWLGLIFLTIRARHLYEKFGFALSYQQPGTQWGHLVNEQRFERQ